VPQGQAFSISLCRSALQRRLHLNLAELGDCEVGVLESFGALIGIVLEQKFSEVEMRECEFPPVTRSRPLL